MSEELHYLSWNNHGSEFCHMLAGLRTVEKYTDVTLACEDQFYPSHKLILSTYSSYFLRIFESTSCKHPVVVLRDVAGSDLAALLNYMYEGKVSVARSDLPRLIRVAKHLQIKGFTLSDEQLASTRKRSGHEDDGNCQQHKRPRKVKQEKPLDMPELESNELEEVELSVRKEKSDLVDEGDNSTVPHIIVSKMKNPIIAHQVPILQEKIFVETTIRDPDPGEDSDNMHIDLDTESHSDQEYTDHKIINNVQDEQCGGRTLCHPSLIKKEDSTKPLDFQEAEMLHREKMQLVATQLAECNKSIVLGKEKYEAILALLRNPSSRVGSKFRHWVKGRRFRIMDLPELGLTGVLAIPDRESFYSDDVKPHYLHVVPSYQTYDIVHEIHNQKLNHAGYKKVLEYLHRHYYGITRRFIQLYCKTCPSCATQTS